MNVYFIAIVEYVSTDDESETTTKCIRKICVTSTSVSTALELMYQYNFGEPITWLARNHPEDILNYFRLRRWGSDETHSKELGYFPPNEKGQVTRYLEIHRTFNQSPYQ